MRRVVGDDEERTLLAVVVTQHQAAVGLRTPGFVGVADSIHVVHTVRTHTIDLLYVVPLAQLRVEGERTVVLNAPLGVARAGFLGGDEDHTVAGTTTVES